MLTYAKLKLNRYRQLLLRLKATIFRRLALHIQGPSVSVTRGLPGSTSKDQRCQNECDRKETTGLVLNNFNAAKCTRRCSPSGRRRPNSQPSRTSQSAQAGHRHQERGKAVGVLCHLSVGARNYCS